MAATNPVPRPIQVTFLGWLFIVVGIVSTAYHLYKGSLDRWTFPTVIVGAIAVLTGFFLLRGARWARWVLLLWLAGHLIAFAFLSWSAALAHLVLLLSFGYVLLGPPTAEYFRRG